MKKSTKNKLDEIQLKERLKLAIYFSLSVLLLLGFIKFGESVEIKIIYGTVTSFTQTQSVTGILYSGSITLESGENIVTMLPKYEFPRKGARVKIKESTSLLNAKSYKIIQYEQ